MKDPLSTTHPELAEQWHPTKNDELTPDDVVAGSNKKAWWNRHTVYSFDHIAINDNVTACDMKKVRLNDEELDVAIFSLSLMGSNFTDYLQEAHRTLKLDGQLHIIEATSRFSNITQFRTNLETLGFAVISIQDLGQFTHIRALKTEQKPQAEIKLQF